MGDIQRHTFQLAKDTYNMLKSLAHWNGACLTELYSDKEYKDSACQGPIVNFNIRRSDGSYVGYSQVLRPVTDSALSLTPPCH